MVWLARVPASRLLSLRNRPDSRCRPCCHRPDHPLLRVHSREFWWNHRGRGRTLSRQQTLCLSKIRFRRVLSCSTMTRYRSVCARARGRGGEMKTRCLCAPQFFFPLSSKTLRESCAPISTGDSGVCVITMSLLIGHRPLTQTVTHFPQNSSAWRWRRSPSPFPVELFVAN